MPYDTPNSLLATPGPMSTMKGRPLLRATKNESSADSLTLGQLKSLVTQARAKPPEPKVSYEYKEIEDLASSLEDWYEYDQEAYLEEAEQCFRKEHSTPWNDIDDMRKNSIVKDSLNRMQDRDTQMQLKHSAILFYLVNGSFAICSSREEQIRLIKDNCTILCSFKPIETLVSRLKSSFSMISHKLDDDPCDAHETVVRNTCTILFFLLSASHDNHILREGLSSQLWTLSPSLTCTLIEILAHASDAQNSRTEGVSLRNLSLLLRQVLLCTLGGKTELQECKNFRRRLAKLSNEPDKLCITTTPLDYSIFRTELISKYPSYTPTQPAKNDSILCEDIAAVPTRESHVELPVFSDGHWSATPAPSPPPSPKGKKSLYTTDQTLPFILPLNDVAHSKVPTSIEEAAALFESRQRTSLSLMEMWQEQEHFVKSERGWIVEDIEQLPVNDSHDESSRQRLQEIERVYAVSLPHLQDLAAGLISHIWSMSSRNLPSTASKGEAEVDKVQDGFAAAKTKEWLFENKSAPDTKDFSVKSTTEDEECRELEIVLKGVTGSFLLLLKWFRVSHILKFEYLSQILLDADWIQTMHQVMMALNPPNNVHNTHDDSRRSYFTVCASLSDVAAPVVSFDSDEEDATAEQKQNGDTEILQRPTEKSPLLDVREKKPCNKRVLYDTINLLRITQKLVKKKTHRNALLVQAKSWLHLRRPLRVSHDLVQLYCLKLYKGQVPHCSRKWRLGNMKIITQIYLSCRPELREDWIAGTDADTCLEEAKQQEDAIRALILHYNSRRYPDRMTSMGFVANDGDSDSDDDFFQTEVSRLHV